MCSGMKIPSIRRATLQVENNIVRNQLMLSRVLSISDFLTILRVWASSWSKGSLRLKLTPLYSVFGWPYKSRVSHVDNPLSFHLVSLNPHRSSFYFLKSLVIIVVLALMDTIFNLCIFSILFFYRIFIMQVSVITAIDRFWSAMQILPSIDQNFFSLIINDSQMTEESGTVSQH